MAVPLNASHHANGQASMVQTLAFFGVAIPWVRLLGPVLRPVGTARRGAIEKPFIPAGQPKSVLRFAIHGRPYRSLSLPAGVLLGATQEDLLQLSGSCQCKAWHA